VGDMRTVRVGVGEQALRRAHPPVSASEVAGSWNLGSDRVRRRSVSESWLAFAAVLLLGVAVGAIGSAFLWIAAGR